MASAVLLFAALALAPLIGGGFGELASAILQILVFAAIAVYTISSRENRGTLVRVPGLTALAVFALAVIVSAVFTEAVYPTLKQILFIFACVGGYVLAAALSREMKYAAVMVWGVVLSSVVICVLGIRHYAISTGGGPEFWRALLGEGDHMRLFGPFINPGFFAGFLVLALPVTLGAYLVTRRSVLAVLAGTAFVAETLALMLTGTKFGVIAAVAALLIFFVLAVATKALRRSRFTRIVVIAAVLLPLLIVFSGPVRYRIRAAESGGSQVHSTVFRIYTWRATADMIKDHPLVGVGPGVYDIAYPRYAIAGPTRYAHQSYLQLASESGVIAAGALLVVLLSIAAASARGIAGGAKEPTDLPRKSVEDAQPEPGITWKDLVPFSAKRVIACAVFAALAGSTARSLVDSDWYVVGIALPFWLLAGVLVSTSGAAVRPLPLGRAARAVVVAACVLLGLMSASFGLGDYLTGEFQAGGSRQSDPISARVERFQLASIVSPLNYEYHRELAKCLASTDHSQAVRQLQIAISLAPTNAGNYYTGALIAPDPKIAAGYLRKSLIYNPHSTQSLYLLARSYEAVGDKGRYESTLRRLLAIEESPYEEIKGAPELVDTTFAYAHAYFGEKYLAEKRYSLAADEFDCVIERLNRWRSNKEMLQVARLAGMLTEREEQSLLELLRDSYYSLAEAYEGLGYDSEAADARKKAENVTPAAGER